MGTITFSGLATGLNTATLVDQLVQVEGRPITLLQNKQTTLQKNVSLLQNLSSKLNTLKSAATTLSTSSSFFVKKAVSSNDAVIGVTASSNADVGNHAITVSLLARASTLASASFNNTNTTTVGTGTLHLTVGGTTTDITVDSSNNTLQGIRNAINSSDAGVTASTITENAGTTPTYRLVLSGKNTGTAHAVTIDASGLTVGSGDVALGITTTQAAQDTTLTVDGIGITRSTNTISDVLTGITLNVRDISASPIQVTANHDTDAVKAQLSSFVSAYNDVMSFVATQTKYDSSTKTAGPLIGDSALRSLQRSLQSVIGTPVTGSPSILAEIGVATQKDGTLLVDDAKLSSAIQTNLSGVSNLFLATTNGVAKATVNFVTSATRTGDGILSGHISSLQDTISEIGKQIDRQTAALDRYRETLTRQFTSLETLVSQIQSQGQVLAQRLGISTK